MILIRGDVAKRYPNLIVYAAKAPPATDPPPRQPDDTHQIHPAFQGTVGGDALYFGLDSTTDNLRNQDGTGWYVVIQESPSEPRFAIPSTDGPANVSPSELPDAGTAGKFAQASYRPPTRVAIHASELIPA